MQPLRRLSYRTRDNFGRRPSVARAAYAKPDTKSSTLADDLRLFATFFMGGVIFMSVYLA